MIDSIVYRVLYSHGETLHAFVMMLISRDKICLKVCGEWPEIAVFETDFVF